MLKRATHERNEFKAKLETSLRELEILGLHGSV